MENKLLVEETPYRLFILGAPHVGKTTLVHCINSICNQSNEPHQTPSESTLKVSRHRVQLGSKEFIFHHLQHLQLLRMILMDTPPCTETSYVKILFHSLSTSTTEEKEEVDTKTDESLLKSDEEDVESYPEGVLVTFALDSASSFELVAHLHVVFLIILKAQEIASEVFKRYHFDPQSSLKPSPVIVLLIGNKSDCNERQVSDKDITTFLESRLGHVGYFETCALKKEGVSQLLEDLLSKLQKNRILFENKKKKKQKESFKKRFFKFLK